MAPNGRWAEVFGLCALPQQVKTCLSHQKGESPIYPDFGTRFAEYYCRLSGSPSFERYLKLEVIRQAASPYIDTINNRQFTPLLCVEGVHLDVKGVGRWKHELSVCVPQEPVRNCAVNH